MCYKLLLLQKFRVLFDLSRFFDLIKDLLLRVNPCNTLKNVHTKKVLFSFEKYSPVRMDGWKSCFKDC